jgi:iron complex transport system substrate-binding protein
MKTLAFLALWVVVAGCDKRSADPAARDASRSPDRPRARVCSLTPSATEIVAAVGAVEMLVGVDQYSSYPESVKALPKVGDFLSPNLEAIVALGCDIAVLDAVQERFVDRLKSSGLKVLALPMQNTDDIRGALRAVGEAVGRGDAAAAQIAKLDASLRAAEDRARAAAAAAGGKAPRVLFVVDRRSGGLAGMVAAGPGTYIDDLLRRAGVVNVLADAPVRYVQISAEEVLARAPDVILDAVHADDPDKARKDWDVLASVPAVATRRVHVLGDPLFVTPGPRLDQAFTRLVDILWSGK